MKKTLKVGDYVGFKCDIEQTGEIVKITDARWPRSGKVYHVRAFEGEYVDNRKGTIIQLGEEEIW